MANSKIMWISLSFVEGLMICFDKLTNIKKVNLSLNCNIHYDMGQDSC